MKRILATAAMVIAINVTVAPTASAQPGPGDKQCVPGQQGNPHPGFKAGVCDNR
ncbi:MAG TPA: hypothetical protein VI916_03255 [Acidimicrobiia bacterium]|nr:hypothetical protein [Acidimicrobiia bacterium]